MKAPDTAHQVLIIRAHSLKASAAGVALSEFEAALIEECHERWSNHRRHDLLTVEEARAISEAVGAMLAHLRLIGGQLLAGLVERRAA